MPTRRTTIASTFAGLAIAGSLLGLTASPASALSSTASSSSAPAPASGPKSDGAHGICLRATRVEARITRDLARLNGPVTEKGSVARLQQRVTDAQTAGHTAVETYLNDRLTARKALVGTLTQRQTDLAAVKTWCAANDNGKDK
jgi:hypothetical protein